MEYSASSQTWTNWWARVSGQECIPGLRRKTYIIPIPDFILSKLDYLVRVQDVLWALEEKLHSINCTAHTKYLQLRMMSVFSYNLDKTQIMAGFKCLDTGQPDIDSVWVWEDIL